MLSERLVMRRIGLPWLLVLATCGGGAMPPSVEDAGPQIRTAPRGAAPSRGPNCVLDAQCALVEEPCTCRCRLNTDPAGLAFPNVACTGVVCSSCDGRVAFCDHRTFTCQMR